MQREVAELQQRGVDDPQRNRLPAASSFYQTAASFLIGRLLSLSHYLTSNGSIHFGVVLFRPWKQTSMEQ